MSRSAVKRALFFSLRFFGVNALVRAAQGGNILVLTYHGVLPEKHTVDRFGYHNTVSVAEFDRHLRFLRRHFHLLGVRDLQECVRGGRKLPPHPAVVTFDDGYRNNLTYAAPVLVRHGVSAVVFVSTGYIGERRILWPTEIVLRVLQWPLARLAPPEGGGEAEVPADLHGRRELAGRICRGAKRQSAEEATKYLAYLRAHTRLDPGLASDDLHAFMTWDEVRELNRMGIDIGAHTVEHTILSRLTPEEFRRELRESKARVERETGTECFAMAYPNGTRLDFTPAVVAAARESGYTLAFTVTDDFHPAGGDPLAFNRMVVPGQVHQDVFEAHTCGSFRMLNMALGSRPEAAGV